MKLAIALAAVGMGCVRHPALDPPSASTQRGALSKGAELFTRAWVPADPRSRGGDGLGPAYNATSCVSCHAQGGVGGAGGAHANVQLVVRADGSTDVVHHYGGRGGEGATSVRSSPALFGAGLIDAIPDAVIEGQPYQFFAGVRGRVAHDGQGRVARFGWKGQIADLKAFVVTACAVELGLENAYASGDEGPNALNFDMDEGDVDALVSFVAMLPRPVALTVPFADRGEQVFAEIGCVACHVERLGELQGLYSDLLLHDMGEAAADAAGNYYGRDTSTDVASPTEWRTPPLWGLRDSPPYLHDGRAATIHEAIMLHDGEAAASQERYLALSIHDRLGLDAFLQSLAAPLPLSMAGGS